MKHLKEAIEHAIRTKDDPVFECGFAADLGIRAIIHWQYAHDCPHKPAAFLSTTDGTDAVQTSTLHAGYRHAILDQLKHDHIPGLFRMLHTPAASCGVVSHNFGYALSSSGEVLTARCGCRSSHEAQTSQSAWIDAARSDPLLENLWPWFDHHESEHKNVVYVAVPTTLGPVISAECACGESFTPNAQYDRM